MKQRYSLVIVSPQFLVTPYLLFVDGEEYKGIAKLVERHNATAQPGQSIWRLVPTEHIEVATAERLLIRST